MPELPEVETVVRDLRTSLIGRTIRRVEKDRAALRRPWRRTWEPDLLGKRYLDLDRRGKWIIGHLSEEWRLLMHLGMTGQLIVVPADEPRRNHTHLIFGLDQGQELRFRDIRRFGSATLYRNEAMLHRFFRKIELGPEPFDLDQEQWHRQLLKTRRCVKAVLLDQRVVAGVGNIYADEALHRAKLHPARLACELSREEADRLAESVAHVLRHAIEHRGSSIRDYIGGSGLQGNYQNEFLAYGRTGLPCAVCETPLKHAKLVGRSTHYCPRCQTD